MGQPDFRGQLVAGPLRNVSCGYRNQAYVGTQVFPLIDVDDPKSKIMKYLKGSFFRDEAAMRGPGGEAKRGGYLIDWVSISTKEFAFAKEVTIEDRRACRSVMGPPLDPDQKAIEFATDKIDLAAERRIAALVKATDWCGAGAGGEDAGGLWAPNDATNTFLEDVTARKETIQAATGAPEENLKLLVTRNTWNSLCRVDAILNLIRYTQIGVMQPGIMAQILGIGEVIIAGAIVNTAVEKKDGTDWTSSRIWETNAGKGNAFLFYKHPTVGLDIPLAGAHVRLRQTEEGGGLPRRTTTWYEDSKHQDVYEVAEETYTCAVETYLGFHWKDTILT